MKKTVYYLVFVMLMMLTTAVSCTITRGENEPEEQELPTGENTIYYYVDGKLYIPEDQNIGGILTPAIDFYFCTGGISLQLYTTNMCILFYNGIHETGEITLNQSNYDACQVRDNHGFYVQSELWDDGVFHTTWYYTHDGSGTVNITYLSEDKRKFKGTFEMTVYHENTNEPIEITDGHFNINLDTLNE